MEKLVIIGSGPAGLTAAIYAARASLNPIVIAGLQPGGQLTTTSIVENWPGAGPEGIDGNKLMAQMRAQAEHMGARFTEGRVIAVAEAGEKEGRPTYHVQLDDETIASECIIVATGASAITLKLPNEAKLMGYGLSTCAVCDGFFYRNKKVAVVGGGDSAMEEATYLSKLAAEVTLIHRREKFRASKTMQDRVKANPKIKVITSSEVFDTTADAKGLTGIKIRQIDEQGKVTSNEVTTIDVDGLFMAIGHHPNTEFMRGICEMDAKGYLKVNNGTFTNRKGIFAAGDVEDQIYRQAITAAARGCQAALLAERYLEGHE